MSAVCPVCGITLKKIEGKGRPTSYCSVKCRTLFQAWKVFSSELHDLPAHAVSSWVSEMLALSNQVRSRSMVKGAL